MPPLIGLGTYLLNGKNCVDTVRAALKIGYRHLDTAFAYENHKEIAEAIKGFNRGDLFITSKFTADQVIGSAQKGVEKVVERALKELKTDYLDLMLIHWPEPRASLNELFQALEPQIQKGNIRFAGVSNYTIHHLQDSYDAGLKISFNQVEFHPFLYQKKLLDFCKAHGTQLIAYRPFGQGNLIQRDPLFTKIGSKYRKSPAQVILRWIVQKEIPVVPKASSPLHLKENFSVFDFTLTHQEMEALDQLNRGERFCKPDSPVFDY